MYLCRWLEVFVVWIVLKMFLWMIGSGCLM